MRVAAAKYRIGEPRDFDAFAARQDAFLREANAGGARLAVLPEYLSLELAAMFEARVRGHLRRSLEAIQPLRAAWIDLYAGLARALDMHVVAGDTAAIETAARASGMAMAADADPRMMSGVPAPLRELGMQTHRGFDALADRMKAAGTRDDALRALAQITSSCVACHALYRLDESR